MVELPNQGNLGPLEAIFEAFGRVLIVLDGDLRVIRASHTLDALAGQGASERASGQHIENLIGSRLFAEDGPSRTALLEGRREEGRRAILKGDNDGRLVSVSAAPLPSHVRDHCDPRARYLLLIRPAEDEVLLLDSLVASYGLVARSAAMLRVVRLLESLHRSEAPILITGESGTGKEVIARGIHAQSPRREGPFVAVNCGALPAELLESELYGHVRGAFTGAVHDRVGRFELAAGGTLFLDEIGDMPLPLQVKLLRVIQEARYERLGESEPRPLNARIIAATNVDLEQAIADGEFRDDLYYRLRVVPIHVPPLRERPEDIAPLAQHIVARINRRDQRALRLSRDTLDKLVAFPWPGNVRALENALEYAFVVCPGQTLLPEHLPEEVLEGKTTPPNASSDNEEAQRIRQALEESHWNREEAALRLKISRTTLWRRMRALGLTS